MLPVGDPTHIDILSQHSEIMDKYIIIWNTKIKPAINSAITEWTSDEQSLDPEWSLPTFVPIIFPSGLAINLLDVIDVVTPVVKTIVNIGAGVTILVYAGLRSVFGDWVGGFFNDPTAEIPGSDDFYFYRNDGSGYELKVGSSFTPPEYYTQLDFWIDVIFVAAIAFIIAALIKLDLARLAFRVSRKIFFRTYSVISKWRLTKLIKETNVHCETLLTDVNDVETALLIVDGIADSIQTDVTTIDTTLDTVKTDVDDLGTINADIHQDIVVVQSTLNNTESKIDDVTSIVSTINSKTEIVDTVVDDIIEILDREFADDGKSVETVLQAVKTKIDAMPALP